MANEKHAVVRLDLMSGTTDGSLLKSVKVYKNDNPVAIDNAQLVVLGEREGREVYKATAPTAESKPKDLVLIASEELFYDETRTHYLNGSMRLARSAAAMCCTTATISALPRKLLTVSLKRASLSALPLILRRLPFRKLLTTRPLVRLRASRRLAGAMVPTSISRFVFLSNHGLGITNT